MNNTQLNCKNLKSYVFRAYTGILLALTASLSVTCNPSLAQEVTDCKSCIKKATILFSRGKIINASELLESWNGKCQNSAQFQLLRSTILSRRHGFKAQAAQAAKRACQLDPNSKAAHLQLGMCLMAQKDQEGAALAFQNLVNIDPGSYEGWSALGQLYTQLGKHAQAKVCQKKAACLEPESREAKLKVVSTLTRIKKFQEAKKELQILNQDDHLEPEFYIYVSKIALNSGAFKEAIVASQRVLSAYPDSSETLHTKALAQLWLGQYRDCLQTTTKIKQKKSDSQKALAIESLCYIKLGNKKSAQTALDKALALSPNEKLALLAKGIIQFREGKVSDSIESLHESLAKNDLFAPSHLELAKIYMKLGNTKEALDEAREAARRSEYKAHSLAIQGRILLSQSVDVKTMKTAKAKLAKATSLDDSVADIYVGKSEVYLKSGNVQNAKDFSQKALNLEPGSVDAIVQLAKINELNGKSKAASKLMQKAKALAPGQGDVIIAQAELLIEKGDGKKAIKLLKSSKSAADQFPPIDFKLAKLFNQMGERKNAAKYFENSLNKGLVGKNAIEARRQIQEINSQE